MFVNLEHVSFIDRACLNAHRSISHRHGEKAMPTKIDTDPALLQRLAAAAKHPASGSQLRKQRVSFIYGNLPQDSTITRDDIRRELETING